MFKIAIGHSWVALEAAPVRPSIPLEHTREAIGERTAARKPHPTSAKRNRKDIHLANGLVRGRGVR